MNIKERKRRGAQRARRDRGKKRKKKIYIYSDSCAAAEIRAIEKDSR